MSEARGKTLALIPARGGSKRMPRKNIRPFLGTPILSYSIATALAAGSFDEVMVSTDDDEIAALAQQFGAAVPFRRSAAASGDHATTVSVVNDVLASYASLGRHFDQVCCIYPTAVLTRPETLNEGYKLLMSDEKIGCVFPVMRYGHPIQRALYREGNGMMQMVQPEHGLTRTQDLRPAYHDAGQWYWSKTDRIAEGFGPASPASAGYVISEQDAQDIDNEDDWLLAELKYRLRHPIAPTSPAL